jgi:hypothetical protein
MGAQRLRNSALAAAFAVVVLAPSAGAHQPGGYGVNAEGMAKPGLRGGEPVPAPDGAAEIAKTRARFFGAENVDPRTGAVRRDRLIFSWFGVTNFAVAIRGHVVLLDAWVPRGAHSGYVPTNPAELAALDPELILLGHAHFDHGADAVPIATASGATIVGTGEHCAAMAERRPALPPPCREAIPAGALPGTSANLDLLPGVGIRAVEHLHSAVTGPNGYHMPVAPPPSTTTAENPPTHDDMVALFGTLGDDEGGSVLYRFRVGETSFVWHDSAGPLTDEAPELLELLRGLRPVDLQVGAIQGFNQLSDGMRDPRSYIEALGPATFVPAHHDDWAAGITTKGANYEAPLTAELEKMPPAERPAVRFIRDPEDYVNPSRLTFRAPLDPLRMRSRCAPGTGVVLRVGGDTADVEGVRFEAEGARPRADGRSPYRARFRRDELAGDGPWKVRASARIFDGSRERFVREACG